MLPSVSQERECRYGREDICFGKFYKAATNTNKRLLREVFKILFHSARVTTTENKPSNIEDYCFDVLGWSRKKYRDSFNAEERKRFTTPLESFEGDVSLLNKLLIKLFDNVDLPTNFFNALRELKNIRNRVCHDQLDFDEDTLHGNIEDLKLNFRKLLYEIRITFSIDVSKIESQYCDEVDEILAAPITGEGTSYFDKMERFREDLMGKFITHGRKELFSFYSKLKILNPFTWLRDDKFSELQVEKIFTPVQISNHDILVNIEDLLVTEPYDENTMEYTGTLPSVVLLTGIAGSGKTSLCRYFLSEWRSGPTTVTNLRSVDILILIEARNIATNSLVTFLQQSILKETCSHFETKDILPTLQKLNVLYIIDGMDEATANGRELLDELFSVLGNSRVIVTTRPEFTSVVVDSILSHHLTFLKLQIHGFSDAGVIKFTSKVLQSLEKDDKLRKTQEEEFSSFLMTTGKSLGDHLKIPLTLALMIILWKDEKSSLTNITSVTKLYYEIFKLCSTKMLSRMRKLTYSSCLELNDFTEKLLQKLGKIAYHMIGNDQYVITEEIRRSLTSLCEEYGIDSIQVLSAFLMCEVYEDLYGINHKFTFIHKSQMEYLAGYYQAQTLKSEFEQLRKTSSEANDSMMLYVFNISEEKSVFERFERRKMLNAHMFTIGHLCMQEPMPTDLVCKIVLKILSLPRLPQNFAALWRLVQESECHPTVCKLVSDSISQKIIWQPQAEELCNPMGPIYYLLTYTNFKPKKIILRIVGNAHGMLMKCNDNRIVVRPYINLKSTFKFIKQNPEVDVALQVDQHFYNWGDQEVTDVYLKEFSPGSNLTSFMGHLDVEGAKLVGSFRQLKVLNARISNVETLYALNKSIGTDDGRALQMEISIRLDASREVLPSSLSNLDHFPPFTIVMMNVDDKNAVWAAEVIAQLNKLYNGVQLMSSTLTADGGKKFLSSLSDKKVKVKKKISIHTFNRPEEKVMTKLEKNAKCTLEWW